MKITYKTTFKGYLVVLRSITKLIHEKKLTFTQLGAYLSFVFQADWSKQEGHRYACIIRDDAELAREFGLSSSTLSRQKKSLIKLGYLIEKEGLTYVKNMSIFEINTVKTIVKSGLANTQEYFAKTEDDLAETLLSIAKTQVEQPQNKVQSSKFSFKSGLNVSDSCNSNSGNDIDPDLKDL